MSTEFRVLSECGLVEALRGHDSATSEPGLRSQSPTLASGPEVRSCRPSGEYVRDADDYVVTHNRWAHRLTGVQVQHEHFTARPTDGGVSAIRREGD